MTSHSSEQKASPLVEVEVKRLPSCKIEMHVKALRALVDKARQEAIRLVGKEVSFPGFRKGKAPKEMIEKKYPQDVHRQTQKCLADLAFKEAQTLEKIPILNNNSSISYDLKESSEEGVNLLFTFETEPSVPKVDREKFAAKPIEKAEVGEKQIEEAIRQMRFFFAKWTPVERVIQDGDYIIIDLDTIDGGKEERVFSEVRFEVSKERMAEWMKKLVEGAKSGDVLEGMSESDDTMSEEEKKAFSPKLVRLHIRKVEEALLPEVDDEFAKKVGAKDVASMRSSVEELLKSQAEEKAEKMLQEQVSVFLMENYPFDLPFSLVETEKNHRLKQQLEQEKFKQQWDGMKQEERKNIEDKLFQESEQAVRLFYLSREIVKEAGISVTHNDVQNEAIALYRKHTGKTVETEAIPKDILALALSTLILSKAQEYILEKA